MKPSNEQAWVKDLRANAKEACDTREDGTRTDLVFHEQGMNWTPQADAEDIRQLVTEVTRDLLADVDRFEAASDPESAASCLKRLMLFFPDHPDSQTWQKRLEKFKKK